MKEEIRTVMIDKCPSEIASAKTVLPNAVINLCDYHVKTAIKKHGVKEKNWDELAPLIDKMIYAYSVQEYSDAYEVLKSCASVDFASYMKEQWHECSLVWVLFKRHLCVNLGVKTTGRAESHNDKIKRWLIGKKTMAILIRKLRTLQKTTNDDAEYQDFVSLVKRHFLRGNSDPVLAKIFESCTPFVAKLLKHQYTRSWSPASATLHVTDENSCDCPFFKNYMLPCSHIFRFRAEESNDKIYSD